MNLIIVESPTKARKLSEYLGNKYQIEASIGHVRDLPKKKLGIDLDNDFEPTYEIDPDKKDIVKKLQTAAAKADKVYLATDPDREGEAIAWHIQQLLSDGKKQEADKFLRSTFHEITKSAVMEAIDHPTKISLDLVDAQQARRVLDRLVGYQVSPVLWKKVRRGLSAGRVQSVALRLIAEREKEIEAFKPDEYWEVDVLLSVDNISSKDVRVAPDQKPEWLDQVPEKMMIARLIEVDGKKYEPTKAQDTKNVVDELPSATYVISGIEQKTRERVSLPPFTTSTLQQAAANKLGFTSKQTMSVAQQLYEEGLITYHRTDSVSLSSQSISMARQYIGQQFGEKYVPEKPRYFAQKSKNAQEAHEAIRVTNVSTGASSIKHGKISERHIKLYDLIWRRFLASQMSSAVYDQTAITITAKPKNAAKKYTLRTSGSVLRFDGWMKLFTSQDDVILPPVKEGEDLYYATMHAAQKFTLPPPRYNDASLVKELEKRGIGRPSTYASIISVIVDRGYVERKEKRFFATATGLTVSDFLIKYFTTFMDYDFTAEMEEDLDRISRGEKVWRKVIKEFYTPLSKTIDSVTKNADRVQIPVEETGEDCPICGKTDQGKVVIRTGKFGKFKSCSRFPDCKYTENIVEKLEGMKCPLCKEGEVIIKNSRWGKSFFGCSRYPECDWASWSKPDPQLTLTQAEWDVMKAERQARKDKKAASRLAKGGKVRKARRRTKPKKTAGKKQV